MIFTDYLFIPLVLMAAGLFYLVPGKRWVVLLLVSLLFYITWGVELLPFVLGAVLAAWIGGRLLGRNHALTEQKSKDTAWQSKDDLKAYQGKMKRVRRIILWLSVAAILVVLVYVKAQPYLTGIPGLSGLSWFFVPLGISYYSMSLVGYLADVYWKKEKPERSFFKLLLFAVYFPKILEGPISRHKNLAGQWETDKPFDPERFVSGLWRMLWGFFKKLVIADRLVSLVNTIYGDVLMRHGALLLVGAVGSAFTLYMDFSGCMDIALGTSELFGIQLEENFQRPFFSQTAAEFWRRWHITLGAWFKDYIYMPLAVSPRRTKLAGKIRKRYGKRAGNAFLTILPLTVVWLLTGLWHGTGWNYIVWGAYWGLLIILSNVLEPEYKRIVKWLKISEDSQGWIVFRRFRTFMLFVISRIITVPGDIHLSWLAIRRIFTDFAPWQLVDGTLYKLGLNQDNFLIVVFSLLIVYFVSRREEKGVPFTGQVLELPTLWRCVLFIAGVLAVAVFGVYGAGYNAASFVYMNF